jgi:cytosine/adenosine deaminase-related metal-dependent hydrolase
MPGASADLVRLNPDHPALAADHFGEHPDTLPDGHLDGWIFAGDNDCVADVWARGRHVVVDGRHVDAEPIATRYAATMKGLT